MQNKFIWTPARLTGLSFLALILLGTALLSLPIATVSEQPGSYLDSLFMAVSSVCVTGLVVQDTATYYSLFGQSVILVLIQLGGLGIMTLSASLPLIFGRQLSVSQRDFMQGLLNLTDYQDVKAILSGIVRYTLIIEGLGAAILTARWVSLGEPFSKALYLGIFHSVSAFCNAGFSLFSNSLEGFAFDPVISITIICLIVCGGLGFVVLHQLIKFRSKNKFSFHTKFVLIITIGLNTFAALFFFFIEYAESLNSYSLYQKTMVSVFQAVTTRTAGFNTIDLNQMGDSSLFLMSLLMFIGGAPGGCAGGVKITTVAVLFMSIRALLLGRDQIEIYKRRITQQLVTKSIAILAVSFSLVTLGMILLLLTEDATFKEVLFETVSAFGTVGLSLGITQDLSDSGKLIVSLLMFAGRIGPLALVFLIGSQAQKIYYRYPEARIMVG